MCSFETCAHRGFVTKINSNRDQYKPLYKTVFLCSDHVYPPFFEVEFDALKQNIDESMIEEKIVDCLKKMCSKFDVIYEDSISSLVITQVEMSVLVISIMRVHY